MGVTRRSLGASSVGSPRTQATINPTVKGGSVGIVSKQERQSTRARFVEAVGVGLGLHWLLRL
jgi:hypothetical protein